MNPIYGGGSGGGDKKYTDGFPYTYCAANRSKISSEDCRFVSVPDQTDTDKISDTGGLYSVNDLIAGAEGRVKDYDDFVTLAWRQGQTDWEIPYENQMDYLQQKGYLIDGNVYVTTITGQDYWKYTANNKVSGQIVDLNNEVYAAALVRNGGSVPPPTVGQPPNKCDDLSVPDRLSGECIDIFDTQGKWFTSSPSVAYLDSIGGSPTNDVRGEDGRYGPPGDFYEFDWWNATTLCHTYNHNYVGGRANWRLPTRDELEAMWATHGKMYDARDWPTINSSWTSTPGDNSWSSWRVGLHSTHSISQHMVAPGYASCVSDR
ncbi:DUF1566 domain-containing protein [Shewanella sp. MMG014]|nr:DUF1566 domain-containing protein [Shewanella sp. MMG014]